jgi:predicted component of type VI protein secretion system
VTAGLGYDRAVRREPDFFLREESRGKVHALRLGRQTIGRDARADVRLRSGDVSRLHASVEVTREAIVIADLGSKNGIFRDGQPLAGPTALRDGEVVVVGGIALRVGHAGAQVEAALRGGGEATISRGAAVAGRTESLAGPGIATVFFAALVAALLLWQ